MFTARYGLVYIIAHIALQLATVGVTDTSLQQRLSKVRHYQLYWPGLTDTLYILYIGKVRHYQLYRPGLTDTLYILYIGKVRHYQLHRPVYISLSTAKYVHSLPQICKYMLQTETVTYDSWQTVLSSQMAPRRWQAVVLKTDWDVVTISRRAGHQDWPTDRPTYCQ